MTFIEHYKKIIEDASKSGWGPYLANYPFYAIVTKPSPSMSKHDEERPTYWRIEDARYLGAFNPQIMEKLFKALEAKLGHEELDKILVEVSE